MPMSEIGPRRKRFQIHLSTAIVLMFAAGGLMWANLIPRIATVVYRFELHGESGFVAPVESKEYGWPFVHFLSYENDEHVFHLGDWEGFLAKSNLGTRKAGLIYDIVIAFAILFSVWLACEWWIRRRSGRKGTQ